MELHVGNMRCVLRDTDGAILSLQAKGKEFIGQVLPLFQMQFRRKGDVFCVAASDAGTVQIEQNVCGAVIRYADFSAVTLHVTVTVCCNERLEWSISYDADTDYLVEWIDFPQLAVVNDLAGGGGSGHILLDINEGLLCDDVEMREKTFGYIEPQYPSRGLCGIYPAVVESQFIAYYDDTAGLYLAAEDAERSIKGIDFLPCGRDAVKLQLRLFPGADVPHWEMPYHVVMQSFAGDWHDAAALYREWLDQHLPDNCIRVYEDASLPEWYTDSPLVVTYPVQGIHDMDPSGPNRLFPYGNALPHLDEIARKTGARILDVLMHWEGTAPWAPPYVWPPLGGADMFQDFVEKLHQRNFLAGVYCSGLGYTLHSNINSYSMEETYAAKELARFMCAPADDSPIRSEICQAQRKSLDMCISQSFTHQVMTEEAKKMASSGLDYIQLLDQNHGGTPYFCYSDRHGHPPLPGKWMVRGMEQLLTEVKEAVGDSVLLGCESAASEAYLPYLRLSDNRFHLNMHCGRPVPVYAFLYHEYLHNFSGNSVCSLDMVDIRRSPECCLFRIAYSFLAGDLMTLVLNQDGEIVWAWGERDFSLLPDREKVLDFIRSATTLRRGVGKPYLVYGRMQKPYAVRSEQIPMYKPNFPDYAVWYPAVLTTAYRAPDGTAAQFLVNYTDVSRECSLLLPDGVTGTLFDCGGNAIASVSGAFADTLKPSEIVMLKFEH